MYSSYAFPCIFERPKRLLTKEKRARRTGWFLGLTLLVLAVADLAFAKPPPKAAAKAAATAKDKAKSNLPELYCPIRRVAAGTDGKAIIELGRGADHGLSVGGVGDLFGAADTGTGVGRWLGKVDLISVDAKSARGVPRDYVSVREIEVGSQIVFRITPRPRWYKGVLWDLAALGIIFLDNYREPLAPADAILTASDAAVEKKALAAMVEAGHEVVEFTLTMKDKVSHGRQKGKLLPQILQNATTEDYLLFLRFVADYPGKYIGHDWKISETFATWIINDMPLGLFDEFAELLATEQLGRTEVLQPAEVETLRRTLRKARLTDTVRPATLKDSPVQALLTLLSRLRDAHQGGGTLGAKLDEMRARVFFKVGAPKEAAEAYRQSAAGYAQAGDLFSSWSKRYHAAQRYQDLKKGDEVLVEYETVRAAVAKRLAETQDLELVVRYCGAENSIFRMGVETLLERGQYQRIVSDLEPFVRRCTDAAKLPHAEALIIPKEHELLEYVARAEAKLGHYAAADALYERLRAVVPAGSLRLARMQIDIAATEYVRTNYQKARDIYFEAAGSAKQAKSPGEMARALAGAARCEWNLGRKKEALAVHAQGMKLRESTGDRGGIAWQRLELARLQVLMGDREQAEKEYRAVLALRVELHDSAGQAEAHAKLGELACDLSRPVPCATEYEAARALYATLGRLPDEASALEGLGRSKLIAKDWIGATQYIRQSVDRFTKMGDTVGQATSLNWLAGVFGFAGDRRASNEAYGQVLSIAKDNPGLRIEALAGQSSNALDDGALEQATQKLDEAFALLAKNPDPDRQMRLLAVRSAVAARRADYERALGDVDAELALARQIGSRPWEAGALQTRASLLASLGRLSEAKKTAEEALPLTEKNGDLVAKAWLKSTLAGIAGSFGDLRESMRLYEEGAKHMHEAGYVFGESAMRFNRSLRLVALRDFDGALSENRAVAELSTRGGSTVELEIALAAERGQIFYFQDHLSEAETALREALARARAASPDRVPEILGDLAQVQAKQKDFAAALGTLDEAVRIEQSRSGKPFYALAALGKTQALAGDDALAEKTLGEVISRAESHGGVLPWESLYYLGLAHSRRGKPQEARTTLERAVKEIERGEVVLADDQARAQYRSDKVDVYRLLIKLLLANGRVEDGLRYLERAKAAEINDIARRAGGATGEEALAAELDVSEARISALLDEERSQAAPSDAKLRRLGDLVDGIRRRRGEFLEKLDRKDSLYDRYSMRPLQLEKLQQNLPPGMLVISPVVLDDRVVVFAVNSQLITHFDAEATPALVRSLVGKLLRELDPTKLRQSEQPDAPPRPLAASMERIAPAARQLYNLLLRQALTTLGTPRLLAISATGTLRYLPFAALLDGDKWLIEKTALAYMTTLDREKMALGPSGPGSGTVPSVLALADPDGSLPGARSEVDAIQGVISGTVVFAGVEASKSRLKQEVRSRGFDIVHLATHGLLDATNPEQSNILLAGESLYYPDIPMLDLRRTRLVVLSACQTAVGASGSGVEIAGLAYQFERTHVRSVVASLWPVDDAATAELMRGFYMNLKEGKGPAEGLALAQRALIAGTREAWRYPAYWGAFLVMGSP